MRVGRFTKSVPALLFLLAASACMATKNDIRLLQEELRATRAANAASDAAQRRQADSIARATATSTAASLTRVEGMLRTQNDSLRAISTRQEAFRVNVIEQFRALNQDVNQLAALFAQLPNLQRELRAAAEAMSRAAPPPGLTVDTTMPPPLASGLPGPTQLLQQGIQSLGGGSCRGARQTFQDIVTNYPTYDQMPLVLQKVAESYNPCDGNAAAADSVYAEIVSRYPRSQEAGTALYRRGLILEEARRLPDARALFERVIREYPMSDAARLACQKLGRSNC